MRLKHPKAKGRSLELKVAKLIREKLGIRASRMPYSGGMQDFKGDIFSVQFPFQTEIKNQERINLWRFWEQAKSQSKYKPPLLVISGNFRPILCVMEFEELLEILKKI